ncbi:MAG: peptidyl-prolyl cis-trans isomerase SurA [Alteromonadaceae bacterium]|jgi:peptidyl-prolyl cis-trans isomerase SurA
MNFRKLTTALWGTLLLSNVALAELKTVDKIVAIVDTGVVMQSEVTDSINRIKKNAAKQNQPIPPDAKLKEQVIEQLISRRIQLQMAANTGFRVGDAQLEQSMEQVASAENMSVAQLRDKIVSEGDNYEKYREEFRDEVTISEIKNGHVRRRVYISPQEVEGLLKLIEEHGGQTEEYNVGHILLALPSKPSVGEIEAVKIQAEKTIAALKEGSDFKEMAMTSSSGSKALQGGELGFMSITEMPTLFANAVKARKKSAIVGPLRSGAGFHILTIFDIKGRQVVEINEVRSRHILITPSIILSEEKAKQMLAKLTEQINSGEKTFGELAREYSEDPGSKLKDGEMDWTNPDVFVPAFKDKANSLEIGKISKPFRSSFGWHILEILERRVQDATEKRKKDMAHRRLFNRKFNEEAENWYHEIRAQAYVEILPEK